MVNVKASRKRHEDKPATQREELHTAPEDRAEQALVCGKAEHVRVEVLPTLVLLQQTQGSRVSNSKTKARLDIKSEVPGTALITTREQVCQA